MHTRPQHSDSGPGATSRESAPHLTADSAAGCEGDLTVSMIYQRYCGVPETIWAERSALSADNSLMRGLGRYELLYERTWGLAVLPALVLRRLSGAAPKVSAEPVASLLEELRHELSLGGGRSLKMRVYERSLGLAVIPVLIRRARYRRRVRRASEMRRS